MNQKLSPTIFLLRHGETEWNFQKRRQGRQNSPLTKRGVAQAVASAKRLKHRLSSRHPLKVISSPLGRAAQTASIVVEELGLPPETIEYESSLMECSFGQWEGLAENEIKRRFPQEWEARCADRWNCPAPGGESYADVHSRVSAWYSGKSFEGAVIVVGHGLTLRVFRGIYLTLSSEEVFDLNEHQDGFIELRCGHSTFVEH
ncbi:histidine phosphatase family protein [Ruegeria arenilitoris]|uniref:histidine phosphatase family protein n=1 Tax=Ruegeria arenilitoris TaxID=1173585 RepID=UPI00147CCEC1|nr:histidine phosphatase family protein [Ruegeria arenilitoris]